MAAAVVKKKKRNKDDEVHRLEVENRELKAMNRSLLRELKKRNRGIHREELKFQPEYIPVKEKSKVKDCTQCGKGILTQIKIRHLVFESCNLCDYKQKIS